MTIVPLHAERSPRLYELTEAFLRLTAHLESEEYPLEDVVKELQAISGDIRSKGEAIACVNRDLEQRAETCRSEARRLSERARRAEAHAEWLRAYCLEQLKAIGLDRLDTDRFSLRVVNNPPAVAILDVASIPREFDRTRISVETDKRAILDAFKRTGEIPPGVEITRGQRLEIQ